MRHSFTFATGLIAASLAWAAPDEGHLLGQVRDAEGNSVSNAVVEATPKAGGRSFRTVTDDDGSFSVAVFPGQYALAVLRGTARTDISEGVAVVAGRTSRVELWALDAATVFPDGGQPTPSSGSVDGLSPGTSFAWSAQTISALPLAAPNSRSGASRSLDAVLDLHPAGFEDSTGRSLLGSTATEASYQVAGLNLNEAEWGSLVVPFSLGLLSEVSVENGSHTAVSGRTWGALVRAELPKGSNEFRAGLLGQLTPGVLGGAPTQVRHADTAFALQQRNWNDAEMGVWMSGPLLKDKFFFSGGYLPSVARQKVFRSLQAFRGTPSAKGFVYTLDPATNDYATDAVAGTRRELFADLRQHAFFARLDYALAPSQRFSVSFLGNLASSGGRGQLGVDPETGKLDDATRGAIDAVGKAYVRNAYGVSALYLGQFFDERLTARVQFGWLHSDHLSLASDGTGLGATSGLASEVQTRYARTAPHSATEFEPGSAEADAACTTAEVCPARDYVRGGPGFMFDTSQDTFSLHAGGTARLTLLGTHWVSAGFDSSFAHSTQALGASGGSLFVERADGSGFDATAPTALSRQVLHSTTVGGYLSDAWSIIDRATLHLGLRYDEQWFWGPTSNFTLRPQLSPRVGLVYDFSRQGRSKVYANWARTVQTLPLSMVRPALAPVPGATAQGFDPTLRATTSDEFSVGGEYEFLPKARAGLSYAKRALAYAVESVQPTDGAAVILANPGFSAANALAPATRESDVVTLFVAQDWRSGWFGQVSYTWASVKGSYPGWDRADLGLSAPGQLPDFDSAASASTASGPLPSDITHTLKLFAAKTLELTRGFEVTLGGAYRGHSGAPLSYLASSTQGAVDTLFIADRGAAGRLPWVHTVDAKVSLDFKPTTLFAVGFSVEAFNLFNFQSAIQYDQRFTEAVVASPTDVGTFSASQVRVGFKRVVAYQEPFALRFGLKASF